MLKALPSLDVCVRVCSVLIVVAKFLNPHAKLSDLGSNAVHDNCAWCYVGHVCCSVIRVRGLFVQLRDC